MKCPFCENNVSDLEHHKLVCSTKLEAERNLAIFLHERKGNLYAPIIFQRGKPPIIPPKVNLHLSEEDALAKNPDKAAIVHKGSQKRCMRKIEERFHRRVLRVKGAKKLARAMRHGFKPENSVRKNTENQL